MPQLYEIANKLGASFVYSKDSKHAANVFGQENATLEQNQPRLSFQYAVHIQLTSAGQQFVSMLGLSSDDITQIQPLIKAVDMPSMSVDSEVLNEYNRKRISQKRINFDTVNMLIHDVCDGKTLKFWQAYYQFYYADGFKNSISERENADLDANVNTLQFKDEYGLYSTAERNMISAIYIYQVHGSSATSVKLVNPKITKFNQSQLTYNASNIMELTLGIDYEYVVYSGNVERISSIEVLRDTFKYGEFMEMPQLIPGVWGSKALKKVLPLSEAENPTIRRVGKNLESETNNVITGAVSTKSREVSASVLSGMIETNVTSQGINGKVSIPQQSQSPSTKSLPDDRFKFREPSTSQALDAYVDVKREGIRRAT